MRHEQVARARPAEHWWPWAAFAVLSAVLLFIPVGQDSIWQVWVGRQMLDGRRLYTDILEVNPPLLFWFAMIQASIAGLIGMRLAVIASCLALTGLSLLLTPARYRLPALLAATIMPLADFGKAEQLTLITTIPYVFLIAARSEGSTAKHPWLVGFLAAFGFAMKPWFVIVPLALELLAKRRVRPENVALAMSAVAYAASVLIFAPEYLTDVVPLLRSAYGSFAGHDYPVVMMITFLCVALGLLRRKLSPTGLAFAVAAVAFIPAVLIEAKWWPYQTIPARGFLLLAVTAELMRGRTRPFADALFAAAAILCFYPFGVYRNPYRAETDRHLRAVPNGASVAILSANPAMAWPMVEQRGLQWRLSTLCLWQSNRPSRSSLRARDCRPLTATGP